MIQENLNMMSGQRRVQITTKKFGEFIINKNEYAKKLKINNLVSLSRTQDTLIKDRQSSLVSPIQSEFS